MLRGNRAFVAVGALAGVISLGACGSPREESAAQGGNTAATDSANRAGSDMQDAQIVNIVMTANTGDSALGAYVRPKASSAAVRDFAQRMVREHGAGNALARQLNERLHVTPADHDKVRDLQNNTAEQQRELADKTGHDLDREYIEHEVDMHESVLRDLDDQLIPNADNAELRQLLTATRATVSSHLEQARQIRDQLGGRAAAGDSAKRH